VLLLDLPPYLLLARTFTLTFGLLDSFALKCLALLDLMAMI
jgi:hypothetical protein